MFLSEVPVTPHARTQTAVLLYLSVAPVALIPVSVCFRAHENCCLRALKVSIIGALTNCVRERPIMRNPMRNQKPTFSGGSRTGTYAHPNASYSPLALSPTSLPLLVLSEIITDGIAAVRHALDEVSRHLPQDERTQREYAQRFLEATREGGDAVSTHSPERGHEQM